MDTKIKVGIASAIVAALVALIILDQKTAPADSASAPPSSTDATATLVPADPAGQRIRDAEIDTLLKSSGEFNKTLETAPAEPAKGTIKQGEEKNQKDIKPVAGDEYVIKEKDTLETIAQARYGSKSFSTLIVEANPGLKATSLRIGRKITLPARPAPAQEPAVVAAEASKPAATETAKSYVVVQGDSLMTVSQKVFGTARHYKKIYEANKDVIQDPNILVVGRTLKIPDLTIPPAGSGTVATVAPAPAAAPAGAKVHTVGEKESLWKIAEKYGIEKGKGVLAMMKEIVAANPDRLKDEGTMLRTGWALVIPE
jgi:nucleoid-associated protein YgaU